MPLLLMCILICFPGARGWSKRVRGRWWGEIMQNAGAVPENASHACTLAGICFSGQKAENWCSIPVSF